MPIFTAIAAAIAGSLALSAGAASAFIGIATWALQGIASLGVSLALSALAGQPQSAKFSVKGRLQTSGVVPRSFPLGYMATAGSLVYANYWGEAGKTHNAYLTYVIALSDLPGAVLRGMWVNDKKITLPNMTGTAPYQMGWPIQEYKTKKNNNNHLWIRYYDGSQTTADSFLMNKVASSDRPYGSDRVGYGICYVIVTAQVDQKLFSGFPTFKFELDGIPLYDVSKDSTVGGSGTQRANDPSTWGGDGDDFPAVQIYNLYRGITYNGQWFYGLQNMTAARLPVGNWIAAINKCRATMTIGGQTVPTYRSGGEISCDSRPMDAVNALVTACSGRTCALSGTFKLFVGEPDDPIWSIDDDVFLSTEERTFSPFLTLDKTINGITGQYPEPSQGWNTTTTPSLYNSTFEAEDGRRLVTAINFDLVPYGDQVQYLLQSALNEARRARRYTGTLGPEYWGIEPNDVVSFTSTKNGFDSKSFRVDGVVDNPNCTVMVDLTEVDPVDFEYNDSTDYQPPINNPLIPSVPESAVIEGWSAIAVTVTDGDGNARRPGIEIFFGGSLDNIESVRFQVRKAGDTTILFDGTVPYGIPNSEGDNTPKDAIISFAAILPNTDYELRGILVSYGSNDALWSNETLDVDGNIVEGAWLGVTTGDIRFGRRDIYDGIIDVTALAGDVQQLQATFASNARALWDMASQIALLTSDQDFGGFDSAQAIVQQVIASSNGVSTAVQSAIEAATGPDSALAAAIIALNGATDTGDIGSATFQMSTEYTPATGWDNKIGIQVRGTDGGDFVDAGIFLEAKNGGGGSRILINADQIILVNPGYEAQPFAFVGGVLTMTATAVDIITAGLLQNQAGTFIIDLDAGNIEIWSA